MPPEKDAPIVEIPDPYEKELENLYARRSAIDAVIESLEEYARFLQTSTDTSQKTA